MSLAWCSWSAWNVCSLESCVDGVLAYSPKSDDSASFKSSVHCFENSTGFDRIYHVSEDGSKSPILPKSRRHRLCICKSVNFFVTFLQKPCKWKSMDVNCRQCNFDTSSNKLRLCSDVLQTNSSSNLYHIIGGALGALAFVLLCIFCIRFALTDSNRRRLRRVTNAVPVENNQPNLQSGPNFTPVFVYSAFSSEMPPAYKDVVPSAARLELNGFSSNNPSTIVTGARNSSNIGITSINEPSPPPSYQDVIALSPSDLDSQTPDSPSAHIHRHSNPDIVDCSNSSSVTPLQHPGNP